MKLMFSVSFVLWQDYNIIEKTIIISKLLLVSLAVDILHDEVIQTEKRVKWKSQESYSDKIRNININNNVIKAVLQISLWLRARMVLI